MGKALSATRGLAPGGLGTRQDSACADCLVFGPGCCSSPGFHLRLGASDCSLGLAFCFMGPWTFSWICCPQLPYHPCKNRTHSTYFYSTGGHTSKVRQEKAHQLLTNKRFEKAVGRRTAHEPGDKAYIPCFRRRTHKLFVRLTVQMSQGQPDPHQSKKFMFIRLSLSP